MGIPPTSFVTELANHGIVGLSGTTKLDEQVWQEFAFDKKKLAEESERLISKFSRKGKKETVIVENDWRVGKDVLRLTKTRTYQNYFRDSVVGIYDKRCCITGLQTPELLIASHIVPWSKDEGNRLNPENGLCLNTLHDKAFDTGLLTVTTDYTIRISKRLLSEPNKSVTESYFKVYDGRNITLPERHHPNRDFLDYHNRHIFEK
jgi:putative restriction endonuclease